MKKRIFLSLISCSALLFAEEQLPYTVVEDQNQLTIQTPDLASQKTRKLRLDNGLEALLISDPNTHQSGAALSVNVGSWEDPIDRPGIAHFVEHLLFLGTEKYPEEEGYTRYLDENGGSRNAFTMSDRTVYMFSVNNNGLLGALDRFAQFFISPLFTPSGVDRECKAIHQEFCKDIPLDPWRVQYVKKELANKEHPFHRFSIGNQDTLAKISQDEVKSWYQSHYSSNLMHLIVYSSSDLDTLENEVVTLFSPIKNLNLEPSAPTATLQDNSKPPQLVVIKPYQDLQVIELSWEIPRFYGTDKTLHTEKLLGHILGHEGSTSLLAQLKKENLAEGLGAGASRVGNDQCVFTLSIHLTSKGMEEYETVIQRCYETIAHLKQNSIPRYIFDEVSKTEQLQYSFQSREEIFELVSDHAMNMIDEPLESYPHQTLIPTAYSPQKTAELLAVLTPQNCQYILVGHPKLTHHLPTVKEQWLAVEYTVVPLAASKIKQWSLAEAHSQIALPRPNPYLPEKLVLSEKTESSSTLIPSPKLVVDEPLGKIYSSKDGRFLVPEINWHFTFKTPHISDADPTSHVLADLYCHSIQEQLNAISYEAMIGGLSFSLQPKHGALELVVQGYGDKAPEFLETIVQTMKTSGPTKEQFDLYYESLARDYINSLYLNPLKQGSDHLMGILYKDHSGLEQKSAALQKVTYPQARNFCRSLLSECYVQGTLFGNMPENQAEHVWDLVKNTIDAKPYALEDHALLELASLPSNKRPSLLTIQTEHPANALILTTDCGSFSFKKRAAQEILTKGLEEPFFSELRTKQQTAYIVTNWSQELERHLYSFFAIQSSSHDTRDLLARFELFLESSMQHLTDRVIPKERFESIRAAYIHQLGNPADNLARMGSLLHLLAFQYDGDFQWLDKRIAAFEELTYEEFVQHAHEWLGKKNPRRLALCVNGALPQKERFSYKQISSKAKIRSQIHYKSREAKNLD